MVTKIRQLLGRIIGAALAAVMQYSGTAALYFGTSTLLAAILLTIIMAYLWNTDRERWYRALAILQGVELADIQQAEQEAAAVVSYNAVLERRAEQQLQQDFDREMTQRAALWMLPSEEPPPPPPPDDTEKISADRQRADAERARAESEGLAALTELIAGMAPNKAKEVIRSLWKDGANKRVLKILNDMDEKPRKRILYAMQETKDEELKDLCEILQRIGDGQIPSVPNDETMTP